MFTDPMSLTFDGAPVSLPRATSHISVKPTSWGTQTSYVSAASGLHLQVRSARSRLHGPWREILLSKVVSDNDGNPFNDGPAVGQVNSVGLIFQTNDLRVGVADLELLRSSLLNLVTPGFQARLIGGEQ